MIEIKLKEECYYYDVYHITKAFFPGIVINQATDVTQGKLVEIFCDSEAVMVIDPDEVLSFMDKRTKKHYVNQALYKGLSDYTKKKLAWGIMTGIRPTKFAMEQLIQGRTDTEIKNLYEERYCVSQEKAKLGIKIAKKERILLRNIDYEQGYSLYIGIPFCPTTCAYCSFTSYPIEQWKNQVDTYMAALFKELSYIGSIAKDKALNAIYIGGGTPTTLEANQMDQLLCHIKQTFSLDYLQEFTVEAGRPDSITKEKLSVLRQHGVDRISINPQTMQQKTLDLVGRKHTVESVKQAFELAREMGFTNINMDLIAGLPNETEEDMVNTLEQIQMLSPDSMTVHALAVKRASKFGQEQRDQLLQGGLEENQAKEAKRLSEMIQIAADYSHKMQMEPYYLYRQKNIAGNFENVGYAKVDKAGIYNILIMEEMQTIVAVGAGASTKIVYSEEYMRFHNSQKIVRVENVKDVLEYIKRIDEMIERKGELLWL